MATATAGPAPQALSPRAVLVVFSGLMLGALLASLDQTIVATALPTIVRDLGGAQHLSWVVTGYLLAATVSTPLWGKLGDLLGRAVGHGVRSTVDREEGRAGEDATDRVAEARTDDDAEPGAV